MENGAFSLKLLAQKIGINQITIVRNCHLAANAVDHEGLRVFNRAGSGGRITRVPDGACPFQSGQFVLSKYLRHKAHVFVLEKSRAGPVARDDSRALLAAMLQGKQAIIAQDRRVRMSKHAEQPAFMLRQRRCPVLWSVDLVWGDHTQ